MNLTRYDFLTLAYLWLLSIGFTAFYSHEFVMMKTEREMRQVYQQRINDNNKLIQCNHMITRNK